MGVNFWGMKYFFIDFEPLVKKNLSFCLFTFLNWYIIFFFYIKNDEAHFVIDLKNEVDQLEKKMNVSHFVSLR